MSDFPLLRYGLLAVGSTAFLTLGLFLCMSNIRRIREGRKNGSRTKKHTA